MKANVPGEGKQLHVKIMSREGHTDKFISSATATKELAELAATRWAYIDGQLITNFDAITQQELEAAEDITLTNMLAGGAPLTLADALEMLNG